MAIKVAEDLMRAVGDHEIHDGNASLGQFDPHLSETDTDLEELATQLSALEHQRSPGPMRRGQGWNLLLSGPPGTGKSAYAGYLAQPGA